MIRYVTQAIHNEQGTHIELLDEVNFERGWFTVLARCDIKIGDYIMQQSGKGFLTRNNEYDFISNQELGPILPSQHPSSQGKIQ